MNRTFDINLVLNNLREKRKIFRDENDLKQELSNSIYDTYNNVRVDREYPANFDTKKAIDIVVIMYNKFYTI